MIVCMTGSVPGWRFVYVGFEGTEVAVGGVDPWTHEWHSLHETIDVPHPVYPSQRHHLQVWRAITERGPVTFAAGELSNGVRCIYEPDPAD